MVMKFLMIIKKLLVNVYFLFKYIKDGIKFDDFIKKEEKEIKEHLAYFYKDIPNKKNIIENLIKIIDNKNVFLYDQNLLENIPSNYVVINRTKSEKSKKYEYFFEYCFPLIKSILMEISKNEFFIDLNHPDFLLLNDTSQSINFDEYMNHYFKTESSFFGFATEEIEKTTDEHCLEKNNIDEEGNQIYIFNEVMKILKRNKSAIFSDLIDKYKNKDISQNTKLIVVFQKFQGKFVDILFIVRKENNTDFSIVNLQIKLSNTFKVSKEDKKQEPYQMTYLKEKYQFIFGIKIVDAYVIYMSLFEIKKKFAIENEEKCIFFFKKN